MSNHVFNELNAFNALNALREERALLQAELALLREDNAALNAALQDYTAPRTVGQFLDDLDHYPTCELVAALHNAVTHSNGLDFCERDTMLELAAMLRMEAVRRGNTPAL
jgi:hypothetical protein|tara:strand:- start:1548 stop:1877 length:330 start_codon:yes stop_codon:yes gene_type:complete